jgi:hypothetical protein
MPSNPNKTSWTNLACYHADADLDTESTKSIQRKENQKNEEHSHLKANAKTRQENPGKHTRMKYEDEQSSKRRQCTRRKSEDE